jgi:transcriptional regulator with XRE-family HTH domain
MGATEGIGATLRTTRRVRGWTQRSLAFRLRICVSYLIHIEKGRRTPSDELQQKMHAWMDAELLTKKERLRLLPSSLCTPAGSILPHLLPELARHTFNDLAIQ